MRARHSREEGIKVLIDINKIIVNDRIRKDFGNLEELAEDIKENTLLNALVVSPNVDGTYTLIAGERRLRAMRDILGYTQVTVNTVGARDDEHALLMEISENECRKEFTKTERLDYARRLARIEAAKAKERMVGAHTVGVENSPQLGKTRDKVAQQLGTSSNTIAREQFIENNRDLLDPTDFADWDEGKLSTNKAFQRIKAAQKRAEEERDAARKDAEEVSELYGKTVVQRDQAESERKRIERELRKASITQTNLEMEAESLRQQLAQRPDPEVIEREVEVVREVVPDDVQKRIEWLEHLEKIHSDDDQKLRRSIKKKNEEIERLKVLLDGKNHLDNASWDISVLTTATNNYLSQYGGKVWAFNQFDHADEVTQQEFIRAITSLAAFSQNIIQMINGKGNKQ